MQHFYVFFGLQHHFKTAMLRQIQSLFKKPKFRVSPRTRLLRLEALDSRELLSITTFNAAAELYGPPSYEVWLESQTQEVAASVASSEDAKLDALVASLNAIPVETLDNNASISAPDVLPLESATAESNASVRRVVFEEYATGLESETDVVFIPKGATDDSNASTYAARSGGLIDGGDWPLELTTTLVSSLSNSLENPLLCEHRSATFDASGGVASLADADYLKVEFPELPFGYEAEIEITGSATLNVDYLIVGPDGSYSTAPDSNFGYSGSGGAPTLYIVPLNNAVVEDLESVTLTLGTPTTPESGGSNVFYNFTGDASARTATATFVDDDLEFVSDVDRASDGSLPSLSSNPIPTNDDVYRAYIFADPDATSLADDQLQFITPVSALAKSTERFGAIKYSFLSGNDASADYFEIDPDTGVISLRSAYYTQDVDDVIQNATLQIKAQYLNSPLDFDVATVYVQRLTLDVKPYTPTTTYIGPMEIPEANWKANGVGIRRNTDFDSGNSTPDSQISTTINAENDLILTNLVFQSANHIRYEIVRSNNALNFWKSSTKANGGYTFDNQNICALNGSGNVWAEYVSSGDESCEFTLRAVNAYTGTTLFSETATFRPFTSVACAFVGEFQYAGFTAQPNGDQNPSGITPWVVERLKDGYDVHIWDDGHDVNSSIVDCGSNGEGRAFDEIVNAVNNRGVEEIALLGYSHGGGSVYHLASRLAYDGDEEFQQRINKPYNLAFTSYIDAIQNNTLIDPRAETSRPLESAFHLNHYCFTGVPHGEATVTTNPNTLNVFCSDEEHVTIDDDEFVLTQNTNYFKIHVSR